MCVWCSGSYRWCGVAVVGVDRDGVVVVVGVCVCGVVVHRDGVRVCVREYAVVYICIY